MRIIAPEFEQRLRGYNESRIGESVTFVAQFKAHPAPTVKWFKDEEEVRATERHLLESSSTDCLGIIRLIINDVRTTDEGAYKCKVENREGVASTTGYLSVTGATVFSVLTVDTRYTKSVMQSIAISFQGFLLWRAPVVCQFALNTSY